MCGDHASAMRMLEVPILSSEPPPEASLCPSPACSRSRRAQRRATERPEPPAAAPWSFGRRNPSAARMARTRRCPQRARWHPSFAMGSGLLSLVAALMSPRPSPRGRPKLKACDPSATPVLCLRSDGTHDAQLRPRRGGGDVCPRDDTTTHHAVSPIHSRWLKSLSAPVGARSGLCLRPGRERDPPAPGRGPNPYGLFPHSASRDSLRRRPVPAAHRLRPSGRLNNCAATPRRSSHASRAQSPNRLLFMSPRRFPVSSSTQALWTAYSP